VISFSFPSFSAIYSYKDNDGNVIITDKPDSDNYQILITSHKKPKNLETAKEFKDLADTGAKYFDIADYHARTNSIPVQLVLAIIKTESNFNPKAVSSCGAMGLMQLMPSTSRKYKVKDPFQPYENIKAGVSYFADLLKRFKKIDLALAAYNSGPRNVKKYNGVPPFKETKNYIKKVTWYYSYYRKHMDNMNLNGMKDFFRLGFMAFNRKDYESAIRDFKQVLSKYPNSPECLYNLALSYDNNGEYVLAIKYYLLAINNDPFMKNAYYNLAIIYEKIGLNFKAISTWQKYMDYENNPKVINTVKTYIKELIKLITQ